MKEASRQARASFEKQAMEMNSVTSRLGKKTIELEDITKAYDGITYIRDFSYIFLRDDRIGIIGRNGCGKSTLLRIIGNLDKPTSGTIEYRDGADQQMGFVFQDFNLLDTFTLEDNIYLPLVLAGEKHAEMKRRIIPLAVQLGIEPLLKKYPYEVSGGQKQRAAVARALIINPSIILADEPTGALDSKSTDELLRLFGEINEKGQTILMVTHSAKAASHAGRVLFIKDGEVFHQIYRGDDTKDEFYCKIADTLTVLATGKKDASD